MEIQSDVCEVLSVAEVEGVGVFLNVSLGHYRDDQGDPLEARVRLCSPFHGPAGGGSWHYPEVGSLVVCLFPGVGPHGVPGGDLDEGLAIGYLSAQGQPPVDGLAGALSATRIVFKTRPGEDLDAHVQGDLDSTVGGDSATVVTGDSAVTVTGDETRLTSGTMDWTLTKAAQFLGTLLVRVKSLTTLFLFGTTKVEIESGTEILIKAPTITLEATTIEGGAGGGSLKLLDENALALLNGHTHPGVAGMTQVLAVDTHTTSKAKLE